ncbi:MAG: hypothetical protein ACC645_04310 [Pirellulales bacterium]
MGLTMRMLVRVLWIATIAVGSGCGDRGVQLDDWAEHFVAAQQALDKGDNPKALEELSASIASEPNALAYYQRAKLYSESGDDKAALDDCEAGLAQNARDKNLKWLYDELKKPARKRFKGKFARPPSDFK